MITSDLIEYIKSQLNKNISKDLIISQLSTAGWHMEDIEEGFSNVESLSLPDVSIDNSREIKNEEKLSSNLNEETKNENLDPYRELPEIADPSVDETSKYNTPIINTIDKIEPMKIWAPINIKPKVENIDTDDMKDINKTGVEIFNPELESGESDKLNIQIPKEENIKIEKEEEIEFLPQFSLGSYDIEPKTEQPVVISPNIEVPKTEIKQTEKSDENSLMPIINKNPFLSPGSEAKVSLPPKKIQNIKPSAPLGTMLDIVPKSAMITSYSQDILSAKREEVAPSVKRNPFIKWGIIIFALSLVGGMVFAFIEGSFKIPWLNVNLSVVKKDPKVTLLNMPSVVSKLNSYKVDTEISISSPSLSSITTGLSSGEAVTSKDTDSISIKTNGIVNHLDGKLIFDYFIALKSSILKNDINTDLKYDGSNLYVEVPDLKQVLGSYAPSPTTVSMTPKQVGLITEEFSQSVQDIIKKVDIYNILSGEVPLYVKTELSSIFTEFINSLEYSDKGIENIDGIDMYHYELSASRQSTKKLLVSFVDLFTKNVSDDQKKNLDEALGASSISSFEVWIGKNDDNLYQIKFTLTAPLSRILNLNDSGIAGNEVKLDWVTKYHDLNIPNIIQIPQADVDMNGFINKIKDIKIKDIISSFKSEANSLHNALGSYGKRSNPGGNCVNPNPGSLFSPSGHAKGADAAVGAISNSMNSLLVETNGLGSCYSTSSAWALSVPLFSSPDPLTHNFYCTDSSGNINTISSAITGTICK